ncbi:MAG: DNA-deoxyinosine glycosylase [Bacilli bacterium]|nr:DNA-deoxyinosine glycosylase [Bacilli bacterium]
MSRKEKTVKHELEPIYNKESKILILGSIPSVKSREKKFYYAHPQNKFWRILSDVYKEEKLETIEEKKLFLQKYNIALWDIIKSCTQENSSDSSIKNVKPNNIKDIVKKTNITKIFTTGKTAYNLYNKYIYPKIKIKAIYLPSTSPANASIKYEELLNIYKENLLKK